MSITRPTANPLRAHCDLACKPSGSCRNFEGSTLSQTTRVLLSLLAGAVIGLALAFFDADLAARVAGFFQPVGRLWLNALQMTVVPLVVALVILGVNTANNAAASGRTARTAIVVSASEVAPI